jgi:CMP-N,N'-diacetyllegionaminic acid synthase
MSDTNKTEILGLITARGGSKGVPKKNIIRVAGKSLIAWTIEAAKRSSLLTKVLVSTDDVEIAGIAKKCGAEVPFLRPKKLAQDGTPHVDVVLHAIKWFAAHQDFHPVYVVLLQPTSPMRIAADIDGAISLALCKRADAVVSVVETHAHPYLTRKMCLDGTLEPFMSCPLHYPRRQDLPKAFLVNGAVFVNSRVSLLRDRTFYPKRSFGYVMPPERSLQIDSLWDVQVVDMVMRRLKKQSSRASS